MHIHSRHRSRNRALFFAWLPAILGVCVIVLESTDTFSSANTSGPLRMGWQLLFGQVSDIHWETYHHYLRKTGHFVGYGILALLFYRAWYLSGCILERFRHRLENVVYALVCTLVVASADEYHQSFLPSRTGVPQDVLLDLTGAAVFQLLFWLVLVLWRRWGRSRVA
jgi:VanZ family protein